jgi:hypothetical protein
MVLQLEAGCIELNTQDNALYRCIGHHHGLGCLYSDMHADPHSQERGSRALPYECCTGRARAEVPSVDFAAARRR